MPEIARVETIEYGENHETANAGLLSPSWAQIRLTFESGASHGRWFSMHIHRKDGAFLMVDGSSGLFFALYEQADGFQFQPHASSGSDEEVTILAGGVLTTLPRRYLFDVATTLGVIELFCEGRLDVSVGWEPL